MDFVIFIIGIVLGIAAMLFLGLLERAHSVFHEIDWHDASKEKPALYAYPDIRGQKGIYVVVCIDSGDFKVSCYLPDQDMYCCAGKVLYFAYVEELRRTIPPCPVCSGVDINNPISHYANPSVL